MPVYLDFSLLPGSKSMFPEVFLDPAKWYRSNRIRNTDLKILVFSTILEINQIHVIKFKKKKKHQ